MLLLSEEPVNMPIDSYPQLQEAASPQVLVARSFLRYPHHFRSQGNRDRSAELSR